jgi:hypothetical protein
MTKQAARASVRTSVPTAAAALIAFAVSVGACDVPEEEVEQKASALITPSTVPVGHTERVAGRDLQCTYYTCTKRQGLQCVQYGGCTNQTWGEKLYADSAAVTNNRTFPAYAFPGEQWTYRGCGPQAAMNVLAWFGVGTTLEYVASQIETINFPFSNQIGTKPDRLREGLESLLNRLGVGIFTVTRRRGSYSDVAYWLSATKNPVIVLANNGDHYLTVTGYSNTSSAPPYPVDINVTPVPWLFQVIDYPHNATVTKTGPDLKMGFSGLASWAGYIPVGTGGYDPDTFLTIERKGDFLRSGQSLYRNGSIQSPDGRFKLLHQHDGNLVLYRNDGLVLWALNKYDGTRTYMQPDGNLVTYDWYWNAVFATGTNGYFGSYLRVQNDGNLVVYTPSNAAVWSTNTWGY